MQLKNALRHWRQMLPHRTETSECYSVKLDGTVGTYPSGRMTMRFSLRSAVAFLAKTLGQFALFWALALIVAMILDNPTK